MSRILWFAIGYIAGLHAVGMSHWASLSFHQQFVVLSLAVGLTAAAFIDRHIAPRAVDGDADV